MNRHIVEKLSKLDRKVIFLLVGVAVFIPLLFRIITPTRISEPVRRAYQSVNELKEGSVVMISVDFDPTSAPECMPMYIAFLRHCFSKNLKVIVLGHIPYGIPLAEIGLEKVAKEYGKEYGKDFINLGFRPGYIAIMVGLGREIRDFYAQDYKGRCVDSFPIMRNVHNYNDIDLLIDIAHGYTADHWIQYAGARYGQRIILGTTGVVAPDVYPYLQAGQIEGIVGGLKGASEYEQLVNHPDMASLGMPAQSIAHFLVVLLVIIGNITFFITRKRK